MCLVLELALTFDVCHLTWLLLLLFCIALRIVPAIRVLAFVWKS